MYFQSATQYVHTNVSSVLLFGLRRKLQNG